MNKKQILIKNIKKAEPLLTLPFLFSIKLLCLYCHSAMESGFVPMISSSSNRFLINSKTQRYLHKYWFCQCSTIQMVSLRFEANHNTLFHWTNHIQLSKFWTAIQARTITWSPDNLKIYPNTRYGIHFFLFSDKKFHYMEGIKIKWIKYPLNFIGDTPDSSS